jgi:hypothetical protein
MARPSERHVGAIAVVAEALRGGLVASGAVLCQDRPVRGHEAQLESTLRAAAALPAGERIVAAWSGYLVELRPSHPVIDAPDRPTAVLGASDSAVYLLSEVGLVRRDTLRFSVTGGHDEPVVVTMAVRGALAIAQQLSEYVG